MGDYCLAVDATLCYEGVVSSNHTLIPKETTTMHITITYCTQ